jgi:hypothetical protein
MMQPTLFPSDQQRIVLSASRRTDLAACYPEFFIEKLRDYPPEQVHSLVIWTKNPRNMIAAGALRQTLERYTQLYVHLTATGLGGTALEPHIPPWEALRQMVPSVIDLVKGPERISWRFDPIIRCMTHGSQISNIELFAALARTMAAAGIRTCRTSWVEPYAKVLRRLEKKGLCLEPYTAQERAEHVHLLEQTAAGLGMSLHYCSVEGCGRSSCIDGPLLIRLHPDGMVCSTRRAKGQRRLCGCTESIDIGWYSQKCAHGCLYCYAEPLVE